MRALNPLCYPRDRGCVWAYKSDTHQVDASAIALMLNVLSFRDGLGNDVMIVDFLDTDNLDLADVQIGR